MAEKKRFTFIDEFRGLIGVMMALGFVIIFMMIQKYNPILFGIIEPLLQNSPRSPIPGV